jgi:chitinase
MIANPKHTFYRVVSVGTLLLSLFITGSVQAQRPKQAILAYYSGPPERLDSFDARQMTHIIYCFGHVDSTGRFFIRTARDTAIIQKMISMKEKNPKLKVLLSLGGWGGCAPCSDAFSTKAGRRTFAESVKELNTFFTADGIDLDWEYPTIPGYPGHKYSPADKDNFTALVKQLRSTLDGDQIITFAAGGFQRYLDEAVDWKEVMRRVDYVNLMSYDLVSGYATSTGHHTALFSNPQQKESTDNAVQFLIKQGVKPKKIVIGAAFYGRVWENVAQDNNGLYQSGQFKMSVDYRNFSERMSPDSGFVYHWDSVTHAPYAYHPEKQLFATFDDKRSIIEKTKYVLKNNLGGIMFWELGSDTYTDGLLQTINQTLKEARK